jgi:hypothetical protein
VRGHLPRARVYGIFTSGAPGSLVGNSTLTAGRVFRRSGARGAHTEQLDTTAGCTRGSEESSFGAARDTDRVLGPHVQAVAATAWAFAPLRPPLALPLDAWTAQYPTATMPSVPTVCHATGLPDRNSTPVPPHPKEASS